MRESFHALSRSYKFSRACRQLHVFPRKVTITKKVLLAVANGYRFFLELWLVYAPIVAKVFGFEITMLSQSPFKQILVEFFAWTDIIKTKHLESNIITSVKINAYMYLELEVFLN